VHFLTLPWVPRPSSSWMAYWLMRRKPLSGSLYLSTVAVCLISMLSVRGRIGGDCGRRR